RPAAVRSQAGGPQHLSQRETAARRARRVGRTIDPPQRAAHIGKDQAARNPDALYCALPTRFELPCVCCTLPTGILASRSTILTATTSTSVSSTGCSIRSWP